jgi:hypothetical protein
MTHGFHGAAIVGVLALAARARAVKVARIYFA